MSTVAAHVIQNDESDGGLVLTADAPGTALRRTSQAPGTRVAKWRRLCDDLTARAETLRKLFAVGGVNLAKERFE